MTSVPRLTLAALAAAALAGIGAANAGAAEPFGQHVAMCAHSLGQRPDPPRVTCTHDGAELEFPNFGAMVEHMREIH